MQYIQNGNEIEIAGVGEFDPVKIFGCGQCFRWNPDGHGAYIGVAFGKAARVRTQGGSIYISGPSADFEDIWRAYFDLGRDYGAIGASLCIDDYMTQAAEYGAGIRILKQEPWETLCSFIVSQCNNIPRIKQIIDKFCELYGEPIEFEGSTYYTFPTAERTAALSEENLVPIRCGYRAPCILTAARALAEGRIDLDTLAAGTPEEAMTALKELNGVGDKVASCVLLFGLHMLDAFPIDTWVRKVLDAHYPQGLDPKIFSPHAGIAQQYMFFHMRCATKKHQ
jgi:N-glycosylase/DNA lyase